MIHPPKYHSTPHWPWSETVHRDDSYHQDPDFFVNKHVIITEKLDGGNTCLWNGDVYARSTSQPSNAGWMGMVRKHHAWKTLSLSRDLVFYGEDLFGIHSIEYDAIPEDQTYRLFAVRLINNMSDQYLSWIDVEQYSKALGIPTVPVLFNGYFDTIDDITKWFRTNLKEPSSIGGDREGFVMRTFNGFDSSAFNTHIAKYVRPNHVQTDQHWKMNWKPCKLK